MRVILASQSVARKRAMDLLGLDCEVVASSFDESQIQDDNHSDLTLKLALAKAQEVGGRVGPGAVIVAGDMFTVCDGKDLQKPLDLDDARKMLRQISGKTVQIIATIVVYNTTTQSIGSAFSTCNITFRNLTDLEIEDYISRNPVLTYAGGYDGNGVLRFSLRVEGDFNFFTGFSVSDLVTLLRGQGVQV